MCILLDRNVFFNRTGYFSRFFIRFRVSILKSTQECYCRKNFIQVDFSKYNFLRIFFRMCVPHDASASSPKARSCFWWITVWIINKEEPEKKFLMVLLLIFCEICALSSDKEGD